jgi:photosystem II stability/assembly factor-like uncharacterized protein
LGTAHEPEPGLNWLLFKRFFISVPPATNNMRLLKLFAFFLLLVSTARAQWTMQESHTIANLRGIDNVGGGVVWASGTKGTVLRTTDDGKTWQLCAIPPNATDLDFRGIQALDASVALVMSSGPGDQSRVYKTRDGCRSWHLVFTNPDSPNGSFKAMQFVPGTGRDKGRIGELIGDPVKSFLAGYFPIFRTYDYGETWTKTEGAWRASAGRGETLIGASNSAFVEIRGGSLFVTAGSATRSRTLEEYVRHDPRINVTYVGGDLPLRRGPAAGGASVSIRPGPDSVANSDAAKYIMRAVHAGDVIVTVGGDEREPEGSSGNAAVSTDGSLHWAASQTPPHGYRSSVAYDADSKTWITVGPNGTDISNDDGHNWRALKPSAGDAVDADKNWNALSLPFVVGSAGRIGRLQTSTTKPQP